MQVQPVVLPHASPVGVMVQMQAQVGVAAQDEGIVVQLGGDEGPGVPGTY